VIFLYHVKEDLQALSRILHGFGEVTGLVTNVQKSMVVSIRCFEIDLDDILHEFPSIRSHFTILGASTFGASSMKCGFQIFGG
jgi:hypothetical protein